MADLPVQIPRIRHLPEEKKMENDYLKVIRDAEAGAEEEIGRARARAFADEQEAANLAERIVLEQRRKSAQQLDEELEKARYSAKKSVDNRKTFLTVELNDKKLAALKLADGCAEKLAERILES